MEKKQITLKEAFRLQAKLTNLFYEGIEELNPYNFGVKEMEHQLKDVELGENIVEKESISTNRHLDADRYLDVVDFVQYIQMEKDKLGTAISLAKRASKFDLDQIKASNITCQKLIEKLVNASGIKNTTGVRTGYKGVKDAEGRQARFEYRIKESVSYDVDKKALKGVINKLTKLSDKNSLDIDKHLVEVLVDYDTDIEINDSLEDVFERFVLSKAK